MMIESSENRIGQLFRELPRKTFVMPDKKAVWLAIQNHVLKTKPTERESAPNWGQSFRDFIFLRANLSRAIAIIILVLLATTVLRGVVKATPGEILYPVKKATEQVEKVFATNDEAKVKVGIKHAKRRLQEVQILVAQNQKPEIVNQTLQELQTTTQEVVSVSGSKPDLVDHAVNLVTEEKQVLNDVEDQVQTESKQTLQDVIAASNESITKLTGKDTKPADQVQGATAAESATSTITSTKTSGRTSSSAAKSKTKEGVLQSGIQIDSVIHSDGSAVEKPHEP